MNTPVIENQSQLHLRETDPRMAISDSVNQAPAEPVAVSLTQLNRGQSATFHRADLRCEDCDMLNAMGMTDHCQLKICKIGDPWIVQVKSTRIGLAKSLAQRIFVLPPMLRP